MSAGRKPQQRAWVTVLLWIVALALVSPLAIYAGSPEVPLEALFGIAAGIALALGLAGRQLHAVLLAEALSGRRGGARFALATGLILLVALLVMVGASVVLVLVLRAAGVGAGRVVPG